MRLGESLRRCARPLESEFVQVNTEAGAWDVRTHVGWLPSLMTLVTLLTTMVATCGGRRTHLSLTVTQ